MKHKIILSMLLFAGNIAYAEVATAITAKINNAASIPVDDEWQNSRKGFIGNKTKFQNMAAYFDKFDPAFNIIEP